jgi:hypothetical protein
MHVRYIGHYRYSIFSHFFKPSHMKGRIYHNILTVYTKEKIQKSDSKNHMN